MAVDLADTIKTAVEPSQDLIGEDSRNERFWELEGAQLPDGAGIPDLHSTQRLRDAIRELFDAQVDGLPLDARAVAVVNSLSSAAVAQPQLIAISGLTTAQMSWTAKTPGALTLAVTARSAIDVLTGPTSDRLRRCASPTCSMFFVALNAKRHWCTPDGCGNRERVARYARAAATA